MTTSDTTQFENATRRSDRNLYDQNKLKREMVEAAMDEYDALGPDGFGQKYPGFGEPKTFWVRPSRPRRFQTYPTKPIVNAALGGNWQGSGGWSQPQDAASMLFLAGYLIVNATDTPIPVDEENHRHLFQGADRIRAYVLTNLIEPARSADSTQIRIRAGDVHKALDLPQRPAVVCGVLRSLKAKDLTLTLKEEPPKGNGPNAFYTYIFGESHDSDSAADEVYAMQENTIPTKSILAPAPQNIILYGPPGTGKTYATRRRAVELIDGKAAADRIHENDKGAIRKRYQELEARGQIAFVTFHQSYGYEDFVEGLRPTTEVSEQGGGSESGNTGFRLEPKSGIFRSIAALAEHSRTVARTKSTLIADTEAPPFSLAGRRVFKMSLGRAGAEDDIFESAIAGGYASLGWGGEIDWSDPKYRNYQEVADRWREQQGEENASGKRGDIAQLWRFREMDVGDVIIVSNGNSKFRAIGVVSGDYQYSPNSEGNYFHRRKVSWRVVLDQPLPVEEISAQQFTLRSCYLLAERYLKVQALERLLNTGQGDDAEITKTENGHTNLTPGTTNNQPDQFVLIIDEINRANISKVFGELITLIEPDKRLGMDEAITLQLPYSRDTFGVPCNLHILGTMNTADRSIALLDTALRRRFTFEELMPEPGRLSVVDGIDLPKLLKAINERIEYLLDRERQIGHAFFMGCKSKADIDLVMATKVIPLLQEYFFEDFASVAAVLGQPGGKGSGFLTCRDLPAPFSNPTQEKRLSWSVNTTFGFDAYRRAIGETIPSAASVDEAAE